ncbi:hypothetical protein FM105_00470 [Brevibacterium yomogidense]|uniref:Uncharacterized protein n=1 Tax=Brevibacterium yomogidense TaxID=946573 RepID=A0A1X6WU50_9MICO|nr:hypothetical protein FM105_00470 [Brevibacterium yomogidense]
MDVMDAMDVMDVMDVMDAIAHREPIPLSPNTQRGGIKVIQRGPGRSSNAVAARAAL